MDIRELNRSVAILEAFEALVEVLDPDNKVGDGVQKPVEEERGSDEERVALALHDGFLVTEVLRRSAGITVAAWPRLVLPVNVHQEEETERHHRQERLEEVPGDRDEALPETVEAGDREQQHHYRLRGGSVTENNPL